MKNITSILVALAPAIASAVVGFAVTVGPKLTSGWSAFMRNKHYVETLKEVVAHLAFYGSALGGLLGFKHDNPATYFVTAAFFSVLIAYALYLAKRVKDLEEKEKEELLDDIEEAVSSILLNAAQGTDQKGSNGVA